MNTFLLASAVILLCSILQTILNKQAKEFSAMTSIAACCFVIAIAVEHLQPVIAFLAILESCTGLDDNILPIMLKGTGITLISEYCQLICHDGGNQTLGKVLQILSTAVVLYISLPILQAFLELIQQMIGVL